MKLYAVVLLFSPLFFASLAHATSYTCDGHEILGQEPEAIGQVVIDIDAFSANWTPQGGSQTSVLSQGNLCGFATAGQNCQMTSIAQSETPGNEVICHGNDWGVTATGDVIMSEVNFTGRVECQAGTTRTILEISNCH